MSNQNYFCSDQINDKDTNSGIIQLADLLEYATENRGFLTSQSSLLEGVLLNETHGLHNIRYFSPYKNIQPISDSPNLCEQKNIQKLTTVLCELFPSYLGTISIKTGSKYNLYSFLSFIKNSSSQLNDIKILAGLLFCTCNAKHYKSEVVLNNCEFLFTIKSIYSQTSSYSFSIEISDLTIADNYKSVIESLNTILNIDVKNDVLTSDLIIKSYIAYYLNISNLRQLYAHYKEILDYFDQKAEQDHSIDVQLERNLRNIGNSFQFPYEKSFELPYALVPIDKQIQRHLDQPKGYWNCVENSLYHFLNCILWDSDKNRYIRINSKTPCVIDEIFSGNIRGTPDKNTLEFWHKLIEDLTPGYHCDQEKEYKKTVFSYDETIKRVFYVDQIDLNEKNLNNYNFEIETGFINFIKVIEIITNKQGILVDTLKPALIKDKQDNVVNIELSIFEKCFQKIIEILVGSENSQNFSFKLKKAYYSCEFGRKDIYGELWIRRIYPGKGAEVEFMLSQLPGHAYVIVTMIDAPSVSIENLDTEIDEWFKQKRPVLAFLIKSYINQFKKFENSKSKEKFFSNSVYNSNGEQIHEIMTGFRLAANSETNIVLSNLINQYILNDCGKNQTTLFTKQLVENFCLNVLNQLPLYDPETLDSFIYPIYTMRASLEIDPIILDELDEMTDSIEHSFKIHNDHFLADLKKKVDKFFQKEFSNFSTEAFCNHEIRYSQKKCLELKIFFEKKLNFISKNFEGLAKKSNITEFELRQLLDNILYCLSIYGSLFVFDETTERKITILEYYMLMNMVFSENINRDFIIGYVKSFVKRLDNEKLEKICAIAEILENYGLGKYEDCIQCINMNSILDYDYGIQIIMSCQFIDKENQIKKFLLKVCNDTDRKIYLENLVSKYEKMVLNENNLDSLNLTEL